VWRAPEQFSPTLGGYQQPCLGDYALLGRLSSGAIYGMVELEETTMICPCCNRYFKVRHAQALERDEVVKTVLERLGPQTSLRTLAKRVAEVLKVNPEAIRSYLRRKQCNFYMTHKVTQQSNQG
jgi:hypothetical protein